MSNWYLDYHHAQLIRLLSIGFVFGVLWPALCCLAIAGRGLAHRAATWTRHDTRIPRGRTI
jgi:hypothetical protein